MVEVTNTHPPPPARWRTSPLDSSTARALRIVGAQSGHAHTEWHRQNPPYPTSALAVAPDRHRRPVANPVALPDALQRAFPPQTPHQRIRRPSGLLTRLPTVISVVTKGGLGRAGPDSALTDRSARHVGSGSVSRIDTVAESVSRRDTATSAPDGTGFPPALAAPSRLDPCPVLRIANGAHPPDSGLRPCGRRLGPPLATRGPVQPSRHRRWLPLVRRRSAHPLSFPPCECCNPDFLAISSYSSWSPDVLFILSGVVSIGNASRNALLHAERRRSGRLRVPRRTHPRSPALHRARHSTIPHR